jgi:predicted nucleic acid-binding protein
MTPVARTLSVAVMMLAGSGGLAQAQSADLTFERLAVCAEVYAGAARYHEQAGRTSNAQQSRSQASTMELVMSGRMMQRSAPTSISDWSETSQEITASITEFKTQIRSRLGTDKELAVEDARKIFEDWLPYCDSQVAPAEAELTAPVTIIEADELLERRALELALALEHPIYDCVYLALAERMERRLITADRRFIRALAITQHATRVLALDSLASETPTGARF